MKSQSIELPSLNLNSKKEAPYIRLNYEEIRDLEQGENEFQTQQLKTRLIKYLTPLSILFLFCFSISLLLHTFNIAPSQQLATPILKVTPFRGISHPDPPTSFWGIVEKPYPTGAFWTNLVVKSGDGPVALNPYGLKTLDQGIQISYGATRRVVTQHAVTDPFVCDLLINATQGYLSRSVVSYDSISMAMGYKTELPGSEFRVPLVRNSPFVTILFDNATPVISSELMHFLSVEEISSSSLPHIEGWAMPVQGVALLLTLGNYQKWLLYCSEPVSFIRSHSLGSSPEGNQSVSGRVRGGKGTGDVLWASSPFTGALRLAILPLQNWEASIQLLLGAALTYPTGVDVSFTHPSPSYSEMTIRFKTVTLGPSPSPLLMLASPHHSQHLIRSPSSTTSAILQSPPLSLISSYSPVYSLKGRLRCVVGDVWRLRVPLPTLSWDYSFPSTAPTPTPLLDLLASQLQSDLQSFSRTLNPQPLSSPSFSPLPPPPPSIDPYVLGKGVGAVGRLALMADSLGIPEMRSKAMGILQSALTPWLEGSNPNPYLYDLSYGGVLSTQATLSPLAHFGSGWYSDHHFHHGYIVFAGAVLARLESANGIGGGEDVGGTGGSGWGSVPPPIAGYWMGHRAEIEVFVRDICNPDLSTSLDADLDFPFFRHKDLFEFHSWASGLFQNSNGKSQESVSEAAHAYYACALYGLATGNDDLRKMSQMMLGMELEAAKLYWHMPDYLKREASLNPSDKEERVVRDREVEVYDPFFAANRVVGNVGGLDVTSSTWFGNQIEFVHGINLMPLCPLTSLLLSDLNFVREEMEVLGSRLDLSQLGEDDAVSIDLTLCSSNPRCKVLELGGRCCPTAHGSYLDCCESRPSSPPIHQNSSLATPNFSPMAGEWRALSLSLLALLDRDRAWRETLRMPDQPVGEAGVGGDIGGFGPGGSKTNSLFWIATRPSVPQFPANSPNSFVPTSSLTMIPSLSPSSTPNLNPFSNYFNYSAIHPSQFLGSLPTQCNRNSACDAIGMIGNCCPVPSSSPLSPPIMLGCCPRLLND